MLENKGINTDGEVLINHLKLINDITLITDHTNNANMANLLFSQSISE